MKFKKNKQFGKNYSFLEKVVYLNTAGEWREKTEVPQGQKVTSLFTEAEMNNMNKQALERVRKGAYDKVSGALSIAATPVGAKLGGLRIGAPVSVSAGIATGLVVKGGMRLAGKSANLQTRSMSEIDGLNQRRLGIVDRVIGDFENKINFVGKRSVNLLRDLKLRLDNINAALEEANNTLAQLKKHEEIMKQLKEVKFFDFQFGAFVQNKVDNVTDKINDFGDKYLRFEKRKGHWGVGRLDKVITNLEQVKTKTEEKIAKIEGEGSRMSELQKKPEKIAELFSEHLGMSKNAVQDLINKYLNPNGKENPNEVVYLINALPNDNPYRKDMQDLLKHLRDMGGKMAEISDMQKVFRDRAEGREKAKLNKAKANEIFAKLVSGAIKEGSEIKIKWDKKTAGEMGFSLAQNFTVGKVLGKKMELVQGSKKIIFDLNTGIIHGDSWQVPMRAINSYTVTTEGQVAKEAPKTPNAQTNEKTTPEDKKPAKLESDMEDIIDAFKTGAQLGSNGLTRMDQTPKLVRDFNREQYKKEHESDFRDEEVAGKIISITTKDNSGEVLIFFETKDGKIVCDIATAEQAKDRKKDDDWTKELGFEFSKASKANKKAS